MVYREGEKNKPIVYEKNIKRLHDDFSRKHTPLCVSVTRHQNYHGQRTINNEMYGRG